MHNITEQKQFYEYEPLRTKALYMHTVQWFSVIITKM